MTSRNDQVERIMKPRRIVFRADAGLEIGTGHVMRCLTLATAVREKGMEAVFVSRANKGNIIQAIEDQGHQVAVLGKNSQEPYGEHPAPPAHAGWLASDWRRDARTTYTVASEANAAWLVVDHYALDSAWEKLARPEGVRLMVIDDLADRPHLADILLDQNAGREASDYVDLVPVNCDLMIGPAYAILRPEFAKLRPQALSRRGNLARPESLLVTLGGTDSENVTCRVLDALEAAPAAAGLKISVIMGKSAPHIEAVRARAASMPMHVEVAVGVTDIADRMMQADLCIGAAGSTAWERCALGLPTLLLVLAENQRAGTMALVTSGAALGLGSAHAHEMPDRLATALADVSHMPRYRQISQSAASLTAEGGTETLAEYLLRPATISFRGAVKTDAKYVMTCRDAGEAWRFYGTPRPSFWEDHLLWFEAALVNPQYCLLIAEIGNTAVGHVRFFNKSVGSYQISIYIHPDMRGRGLGSVILKEAIGYATAHGWITLHAEVHEGNKPSLRIFECCGFLMTGKSGQFSQFHLNLKKYHKKS